MSDQKGLSERNVIGRFYETLDSQSGNNWVSKIANMFSSDQPSETYKWLGFSPKMQEWVSNKKAKGLAENGITITNKRFEATIEVAADDHRRDKTGQIDIRIGELADRAINHWASLLSELRRNGTSQVCYDGQYFYDTDHSEGASGTQKNKLTASEVTALNVTTPASPTAAEMSDAIIGVISHMLGYKDDQGEPMNEFAREWLVTVPVNMYGAALKAVTSNLLASSNGSFDNAIGPNNGAFNVQVAVDARLTGTTVFYVDRLDGRAKPFIRQAENLIGQTVGGQLILPESFGVKMSALGAGSDHAFKTGNYLYSAEANRNVGYGYWQQSTHNTLS